MGETEVDKDFSNELFVERGYNLSFVPCSQKNKSAKRHKLPSSDIIDLCTYPPTAPATNLVLLSPVGESQATAPK